MMRLAFASAACRSGTRASSRRSRPRAYNEEEYPLMKTLTAMAAAVLLMLVFSVPPASAQAKTMTADEQANLKLVSDWWREVIQAGHTELAEKYMAPDYIQH